MEPRPTGWKPVGLAISRRANYKLHQEITTFDGKVKGPASYFPSIEAKYGKTIDHWLAIIDAMGDIKHMEKVAQLKDVHGLGHGHANALVAYRKAQSGLTER